LGASVATGGLAGAGYALGRQYCEIVRRKIAKDEQKNVFIGRGGKKNDLTRQRFTPII